MTSSIWAGGAQTHLNVTCALCQFPVVLGFRNFLCLLCMFSASHGGGAWIVGDSLVRWATFDMSVPLPVHWIGQSGARIHELPDLLMRAVDNPDVIIVHLGTNDLVTLNFFAL